MTNHIRTVDLPWRDPRIGRRSIATFHVVTMCGAPVTETDLTLADARKALRTKSWPVCPECAAFLKNP